MHRIDTSTAVAALPAAGAPGPNPNGYWTPGNPNAGQAATQGDQDFFNMFQEELAAILAAAGIAPVKGTFNQVLTSLQALFAPLAAARGQCMVKYVGAAALNILPLGAPYLRVNGKLYAIPAAGIAVANSNVEVGGVAGQNLAVSSDYLLFVKDNGAGVLIPSFYALAGGHMMDTTAGNVGVEVRNNAGAPDSTRTLVGMVGTDAAGSFRDDATYRLLLNWFGEARRDKACAISVTGVNVTQTAEAELTTSLRCYAMTWADETVRVNFDGMFYNGSAGASSYVQAAVDGATVGDITGQYEPTASAVFDLGVTYGALLAEGRHTFSPQGYVSAGTLNLNQVYQRVYIRG